MTEQTPPLLPPEHLPPIRTQTDLDLHWQALMGPLGFSRPSLWVLFLDADGGCAGPLTMIDEIPARPDHELLVTLLRMCAEVVDENLEPGGRVAFLRSRPGPGAVDADDRAWAGGLLQAAREVGVPCEPVHLATDERVTVVAFDDLTGRDTG